MRKSISVLAVGALTGILAVALAGTAGAATGPKGTSTTTVPKETKVTSCQAKSAQKDLTAALYVFLTGGNATKSMTYIQNGSKIGQAYEQSAAADIAAGLTKASEPSLPTGVKVMCTSKTAANFTYDLYLKDLTTGTTGPPLGLNASGNAILTKGVWYISTSSVCDLMDGAISDVSDPTLKAQVTTAVTACYAAIGETLPPAS